MKAKGVLHLDIEVVVFQILKVKDRMDLTRDRVEVVYRFINDIDDFLDKMAKILF